MEQKFFRCDHCGNIYAQVYYAGVELVCCGDTMKELIPCSTDAATEKHVPVIKVDGTTVTVTVGDVAHPMLDEHFIEWISLQTKSGNQRKQLAPGQEPVAVFELTANDAVESAYAYCNLHSLWKKDL